MHYFYWWRKPSTLSNHKPAASMDISLFEYTSTLEGIKRTTLVLPLLLGWNPNVLMFVFHMGHFHSVFIA